MPQDHANPPSWGGPPTGWDPQPPQDFGHGPQGGHDQPLHEPTFAPQQRYADPGRGPLGGGRPAYGQGYRPPQPGLPQQAGGAPAGAPLSQGDESLGALLAHLSVPFLGFVGPLVVYLVFKDRSRWLGESAVEALNFSLLYTIVVAASSVLTVLLIGFVLLPVAFIASLVLAVLAAVAANRHELYRYPVTWRLVR